MGDTIPQDVPQRQCYCCKQFFPSTPEYFSRDKSRKGGLRSICKSCKKSSAAIYWQKHREERIPVQQQYKLEHVEELKEYSRKYRQQHLEEMKEKDRRYYRQYRDKKLVYSRQHHRIHRERYIELSRQYRKAHREEMLANLKLYRQQHAEELRAYMRRYRQTEQGKIVHRTTEHRRRMRKLRAGGTYTAQDIHNQFVRQKGKCYYCHLRLKKYHIEHVVPLSRGGSNDISNIVLACPSCNYRKRDKLPHEWPEGGRLL